MVLILVMVSKVHVASVLLSFRFYKALLYSDKCNTTANMADLFCVMAIFHKQFPNPKFWFFWENISLDSGDLPYNVDTCLILIFLDIWNQN